MLEAMTGPQYADLLFYLIVIYQLKIIVRSE